MESPEPESNPADEVALTATFAFPRYTAPPERPQLPPRRLLVEVVGGPLDGARGKSEADLPPRPKAW